MKTKELIQKTGDKIKNIPGGALILDSNADDELRELQVLLLEVGEYFMSFDHVENEEDEGLAKAAKRFLLARRDLTSAIYNMDRRGPELFDDPDESGVIEDVLQMVVRKQLFSLFPITSNNEEDHVEATLPFRDEDLTAEGSRIDLATLSLIKAYGDMFDAGKILPVLQGPDSIGCIVNTYMGI